jgi:hypothetical protein
VTDIIWECPLWEWTLSGHAPRKSPGASPRAEEQTGEMFAEGVGAVMDHVVQRGPWDLFDQGERVTLVVRRVGFRFRAPVTP